MIRVRELCKYYGDKRALGPVSFEIPDGQVVGFLGLNGAGKTTALRILACDLLPSSGEVRVGDLDVVEDGLGVRAQVGFLPDRPPLYGEMTVRAYLRFAARLRRMSTDVERRLDEVESVTQLRHVSDEPISNLSHGYQQRVGIAQAIVHRPRFLILDEPISGLDPRQIAEMREVIRALRGHHTVLVSSHILGEISETCDQLIVLREGTIAATGTEAELSARLGGGSHLVVEVRGDGEAAAKVLRAVASVASVKVGHGRDGAAELSISASGTADVRAAVCRALVEGGFDVLKLDRAERDLENIFLKLTGAPEARA